MRDYTQWKRVNLETPGQASLAGTVQREKAEEETNKDLRKPIQQLICDVHEEVDPNRRPEKNLLLAIRRMVSMMGKVALVQEDTGNVLVNLTRRIVILTWAIVCLSLVTIGVTIWGYYLMMTLTH